MRLRLCALGSEHRHVAADMRCQICECGIGSILEGLAMRSGYTADLETDRMPTA